MRPLWPFVAALALALLQTLRLFWRTAGPRWALRARVKKAALGELSAEPLLRRLGYQIEGRQSTGSWWVRVDGDERPITLRADYLVTRDGRRLVADVKTGRLAPHVESAATRRQLLEYRLAFDVDGVLLVDVEAGEVQEVEFALPTRDPQPPLWSLRLIWLTVGVGLGLGAALLR